MDEKALRAAARKHEDAGNLWDAARVKLQLADFQSTPPPATGEFDEKGRKVRVGRAKWRSAAHRATMKGA